MKLFLFPSKDRREGANERWQLRAKGASRGGRKPRWVKIWVLSGRGSASQPALTLCLFFLDVRAQSLWLSGSGHWNMQAEEREREPKASASPGVLGPKLRCSGIFPQHLIFKGGSSSIPNPARLGIHDCSWTGAPSQGTWRTGGRCFLQPPEPQCSGEVSFSSPTHT